MLVLSSMTTVNNVVMLYVRESDCYQSVAVCGEEWVLLREQCVALTKTPDIVL